MLASWRSMKKIAGSGSGSGSISHRHGSGSGSTPKCHGSGTLQNTHKQTHLINFFRVRWANVSRTWRTSHQSFRRSSSTMQTRRKPSPRSFRKNYILYTLIARLTYSSQIHSPWPESREVWPLLTVETDVNGESKSTNERDPSLVRWACHAGTRDFCTAFAAQVGPVQNIFFLTVHFFSSFFPMAQQAGHCGQAAVLGRLSLSMCLCPWLGDIVDSGIGLLSARKPM